MDARIKSLETQLDVLQKRVDVLEGRAPAPAAVAPSADCSSWEKLRVNMTETEVRGMLGAPAKIDATPLQNRWRYSCGTAYFDAQTKRFVGYDR